MTTGQLLRVGLSQGKGRGVFAARDIPAGTCLERAPTIGLEKQDTDGIETTILDHYYFAHPGDPDGGLIVLGVTSLCNHSNEPNARRIFEHEEGLGWFFELRAIRDIAAGEEILHRYACPPWFDVVGG